jgi:hypothetical protein
MGRNLNRQDAKCAKETQNESPEMCFRASKLRFPSVWLGVLGVLAVKSPLHSGFSHEALPSVDTLVARAMRQNFRSMTGSKRGAAEIAEDFAEKKWMDDKGDLVTQASQNPKTRSFSV